MPALRNANAILVEAGVGPEVGDGHWHPAGEGLHTGSLAELGLGQLGQLPLLVKGAGRGQGAIVGQQHQPGGVGPEQGGGRRHHPVQAPRQPPVGVQVRQGADALGQVGRVDPHACPLPDDRTSGHRLGRRGWQAPGRWSTKGPGSRSSVGQRP